MNNFYSIQNVHFPGEVGQEMVPAGTSIWLSLSGLRSSRVSGLVVFCVILPENPRAADYTEKIENIP